MPHQAAGSIMSASLENEVRWFRCKLALVWAEKPPPRKAPRNVSERLSVKPSVTKMGERRKGRMPCTWSPQTGQNGASSGRDWPLARGTVPLDSDAPVYIEHWGYKQFLGIWVSGPGSGSGDTRMKKSPPLPSRASQAGGGQTRTSYQYWRLLSTEAVCSHQHRRNSRTV